MSSNIVHTAFRSVVITTISSNVLTYSIRAVQFHNQEIDTDKPFRYGGLTWRHQPPRAPQPLGVLKQTVSPSTRRVMISSRVRCIDVKQAWYIFPSYSSRNRMLTTILRLLGTQVPWARVQRLSRPPSSVTSSQGPMMTLWASFQRRPLTRRSDMYPAILSKMTH